MIAFDAGPAIAGAVLGLIAGSFLSTLVVRWPAGRGLGGRSACDGCDATLGVRDLVPLLSYVVRRGRCARCAAPIDLIHPVMELACAVAGAAALGLMPSGQGLAGAVFAWLLITLAAIDLRHFWLPDGLTALVAGGGLATGLLGSAPSLDDRLIGGATGFGALVLIAVGYRVVRKRDGMGGGDPKLLGAIGLWTGWQPLPGLMIAASMLGLAAALVMAVRGRAITGATQLPLGTLMAAAAIPIWLFAR